ncbi:MAG: hypothetical protein JRG93_11115 [Deltaproteobacteria bacterium]|nr:hypothetical protein [Deltaproteobacteria bacterium]
MTTWGEIRSQDTPLLKRWLRRVFHPKRRTYALAEVTPGGYVRIGASHELRAPEFVLLATSG